MPAQALKRRPIHDHYWRSIMFGLQDSLVSTTGVVVGLSVTIPQRGVVLIAGSVALAVEAISMAAGQYISEKSLHERNPRQHNDDLITGSVLMFVAYLTAGLVPLAPIIFMSYPLAPLASILGTLMAFAGVGYLKSKITDGSLWRNMTELLVIGGTATIMGVIVGFLMRNLE